MATFEKKQLNLKLGKNEKLNKYSDSRFGELIGPKIFHLKDEIPSVFLSADFARINLISDDTDLEKPVGKSFSLERGPITYVAEKGHYYQKNSELNLEGSVVIGDADSELKANKMFISGGLGYRNAGIFIDLTYVHGLHKDVSFPYRLPDKANTFATTKGSGGNVMLTVGFKI